MTCAALMVLLCATGATAAAGDTVPAAGAANRPPLQQLPSGLGYDELRHALARLRPVARRPERSDAAGPDGVPRREIDGLLVDETQTKIGRDFYQVFHGSWEAPPGAADYTVRVQEQPSPSIGTRIVVLLDEEVLFQLQLQPRYEVIEELAQQAALHTRREVERRQPASMPAAAGGEPPAPGAPR